MKLEEVHRPGFGDPEEPFEAHSRSTVNVSIAFSFAHERGYEEAFAQLQQLPAFQQKLEEEFTALYKRVAQGFISQSSIKPGYGWMDDTETSLSIQVGSPSHID